MAHPADRKYSETHEWVKVSETKATKGKKKKKAETIGTLGITDYAVNELSDLVHIELPKAGDSVEIGSGFGEIESVKTVAELVSPITGKVIEVNKEAVDSVDLIMEEPYEDGWLIKVSLSDKSELDALMTSKEYTEYLRAATGGKKKKKDEEEIDEGFFM
jgi:glycine cleavage system H protein